MVISKRYLTFACALILFAPLALAAGSDAGNNNAAKGPVAVVRETSQKILNELEKHSGKIKSDPDYAEKLVKEYLLPHWDFDFTSQLVLGLAWRNASPGQRKAFEKAFLHYLTATYAKGLSGFKGAKVQVLPFRGDTSKQFVTVQTRVEAEGHPPVEVDYVMRKTPQGWQAFDVKIAGVSYVQTYRNEFQSEIRRTSLQALIARLEHTSPSDNKGIKPPAHKGGR